MFPDASRTIENQGYITFKMKTNTKIVHKYETSMVISPELFTDALSLPG